MTVAEVTTRKCSGCKQERSLDEFYVNRSRKSGFQTYCKTCSTCAARAAMQRRSNYVWLKEYKESNGCFSCGYNRHGAALDAHHTRDKEFTLARGMHFSQTALEAELDKCVILCANCHREFHAGLLDLPTLKPQHTEE